MQLHKTKISCKREFMCVIKEIKETEILIHYTCQAHEVSEW